MAQHYPEETKEKIFELKKSGRSLGQISKNLNIPRSSIQSILYARKLELEQDEEIEQESKTNQPSNIITSPKENYQIREFIQNWSSTDFTADSYDKLTGTHIVMAFENLEKTIDSQKMEIAELETEISKLEG